MSLHRPHWKSSIRSSKPISRRICVSELLLQRLSSASVVAPWSPGSKDALLSVYIATGAQRAPSQGPKYRAVLLRAQEEALRHGATLIGTPHLILALCDVTESDAPDVQASPALSLTRLEQSIRTILGEATTNNHEPTEYTLPLQHVLQIAADVAGAARDDTIDVPHLWIALMKEEHGVLSQLLEQCGVDRLHLLEQMEEDLE